jgi:hypothetical protein
VDFFGSQPLLLVDCSGRRIALNMKSEWWLLGVIQAISSHLTPYKTISAVHSHHPFVTLLIILSANVNSLIQGSPKLSGDIFNIDIGGGAPLNLIFRKCAGTISVAGNFLSRQKRCSNCFKRDDPRIVSVVRQKVESEVARQHNGTIYCEKYKVS